MCQARVVINDGLQKRYKSIDKKNKAKEARNALAVLGRMREIVRSHKRNLI